MISPFLQAYLTILYGAYRATVNAGNTLHTGIRPDRLPIGQRDRAGWTNPFAQATRDTVVCHPKGVLPYRKVSKKRIYTVAFQSGQASFLV